MTITRLKSGTFELTTCDGRRVGLYWSKKLAIKARRRLYKRGYQ